MIRRNVADQPVLIGPLLAVDGTPQTAGADIAVRLDGVAAVAAGTLTHDTDGVWMYTPTAQETDCNILGLILTKIGAVAAPLTVITTRFPTQNDLVVTNGGVRVDSLTQDALTQIADAGEAVTETILLTISSPSERFRDASGNYLTAVTVGQALSVILAALAGDRAGVSTREITATVPGVGGVSVTATRTTRTDVQASLVVPT